MARKIGMDYCLPLVRDKYSLLCSLDADTLLHPDYMKKIQLDEENTWKCDKCKDDM